MGRSQAACAVLVAVASLFQLSSAGVGMHGCWPVFWLALTPE